MLIQTVACGAVVLALALPSTAGGQTAYNRTTFVHGGNADSTTWNVGRPWLDARLVLGPIRQPSLGGRQTVAVQRDSLRMVLTAGNGSHILVAHSMGGLVSRSAYRNNPANIAGIVTIATPHLGFPLSDNIYALSNYFVDAKRRIGDGLVAMGVVYATATLNEPLAATISAVGPYYINKQFPDVQRLIDVMFAPGSPALLDIRPSSPTITTLASLRNDAVPHAYVYGQIPTHHAAYRLAASSETGGDEARLDNFVKFHNIVRSAFQGCRAVGYALVITASRARRCGFANRVMGRIDDRWVANVNGSHTYHRTTCQIIRGYEFCDEQSYTMPDTGPFDGIVPESRVAYPGVYDAKFIFLSPMMNHLNIKWRAESLAKIADAMVAIGVVRR